MYVPERTKARGTCQEGNVGQEFRKWGTRLSAPDYALLIEEVVDDLNAITHLYLRLFGHRENGTDQLA
jgi:hypothetical protein